MKIPNLLRALIILAIASLFCLDAAAVPAPPHPVAVRQPDGTTITVRMYGDEFFMYTTTTDGYNIIQASDGFYYYAQAQNGQLISTGVKAKDPAKRTAEDRSVLPRVLKGAPSWAAAASASSPMRMSGKEPGATQKALTSRKKADGNDRFKSLVILVNFQDVQYTIPTPQQAFTNMLNQDGYNLNGATGSAWNYYYENSNERFNPEFVVAGPYTISQNREYYKYNGGKGRFREMIREAVLAADADIDYTEFADDGNVRDIYVFFAGIASSSISIWPHRSSINTVTVDGVKVSGYACSAEYDTANPSVMAHIGTFCHEFGHVIGWPDFYDIDYEENGKAVTLYDYSLMDNGCYNNEARTPPTFTAMERMIQGWAEPTVLDTQGDYTLENVNEDKAYRINTSNEGEYYLIEYRNAETDAWDAGLGDNRKGLLVTHVDQSDNSVGGYYSAKDLWDYWAVNMMGNHPCYRVVKAYKGANDANWLFPGPYNVTELSSATNSEFRLWSGEFLPIALSGITAGTQATFTLLTPSIETITLNKTSHSMFQKETLRLKATLLPEEADYLPVEWSTSNTMIAMVSADGLVTATGEGQAVITVKAVHGDAKATCAITVLADGAAVNPMVVHQNDAWIEWSDAHSGKLTIELYEGDKMIDSHEASASPYYLSKLKPGTSYRVIVRETSQGAAGSAIGATTFSTAAVSRRYASVQSDDDSFKAGTPFILYLSDAAELDSVTWYLDGKTIDSPRLSPEAGKHTVAVEYETLDGYKEKITKTISVK